MHLLIILIKMHCNCKYLYSGIQKIDTGSWGLCPRSSDRFRLVKLASVFDGEAISFVYGLRQKYLLVSLTRNFHRISNGLIHIHNNQIPLFLISFLNNHVLCIFNTCLSILFFMIFGCGFQCIALPMMHAEVSVMMIWF